MELAAGICSGPAELCRINKVRVHLEVYWVSDIATSNGLRVEKAYLEERRDNSRRSSYVWRTEHPTHSDVVAWVKFVFLLLEENDCLRQPLGDRVSPGHQSWTWHRDPCRSTVYKISP